MKKVVVMMSGLVLIGFLATFTLAVPVDAPQVKGVVKKAKGAVSEDSDKAVQEKRPKIQKEKAKKKRLKLPASKQQKSLPSNGSRLKD